MSTCCGLSAAGQPCGCRSGRALAIIAEHEALQERLRQAFDDLMLEGAPAYVQVPLRAVSRGMAVLPAVRRGKSEAKRLLDEFFAGERELEVECPGVPDQMTLEDPCGGRGQWTPPEVPMALAVAVARATRLPKGDPTLVRALGALLS